MDITRIEASVDTQTAAFDTLARSLHTQLPRRRVAGLLAASRHRRVRDQHALEDSRGHA